MFSERLKSLRKEKGVTQQELAELLNIAPSTIGMYEQGKRTPDHITLKAISELFNCSIDYILGVTDRNIIKVDSIEKAKKLSDEIIQILVDSGQLTKEEAMNDIQDKEKRERLLFKVRTAIKFASEIDKV